MKKLIDLTPDYFKKSCWPLPGCPAIFEHETEYYARSPPPSQPVLAFCAINLSEQVRL